MNSPWQYIMACFVFAIAILLLLKTPWTTTHIKIQIEINELLQPPKL